MQIKISSFEKANIKGRLPVHFGAFSEAEKNKSLENEEINRETLNYNLPLDYRIVNGKRIVGFQRRRAKAEKNFNKEFNMACEAQSEWLNKHIGKTPVSEIREMFKCISSNPEIAKIQYMALNNLEDADISVYERRYIKDIVNVIKSEPEIANIQLELQNVLLRDKDCKHPQLIKNIVESVASDKNKALLQLKFAKESCASPKLIMNVFKKLNDGADIDVFALRLDWTEKILKNDVPENVVISVLEKSSLYLKTAQMQFDWVTKMFKKYPNLKSNLFLGHLIHALGYGENEETVKAKFDFAEVILNRLFEGNNAKLVDDYNTSYGFGITGMFATLSRKKDIFELERRWILEKLDSNEYSLQDILRILTSAPCSSDFSLEKYNEYMDIAENIPKEMIARRSILKPGLLDLTDTDIKNFVCSYAGSISFAQKLLGKTGFLDSFGLKIHGLETFLGNLNKIKKNLDDDAIDKLLEVFNPKESIKGKKILRIIERLKEQNKELAKIQTLSIKKAPMDIRSRKIIRLKKELMDMQSVLSNKPTKEKIEKLNVICALAEGGLGDNISELLKIINYETIWRKTLNKLIFLKYDIPYDESNAAFSFEQSEYLANLLGNTNTEFIPKFKWLISYLIDNKAFENNNVCEVLDKLPQNIQTRKDFEALGINYDRWIHPDENSYVNVEVNLSADKTKQNVLNSLEQDFNDESFKLLPKEHKREILNELKKKGIELRFTNAVLGSADNNTENKKDLKFYYDRQRIPFSKIETIISTVTSVINKNEFWTLEYPDKTIENAKNTFVEHITKLRKSEYNLAKKLSVNKIKNLRIRQTDMSDIAHSLFLGNHSACCTAIGSFNDNFAPDFIKNRLVSAIEIIDGERSVGNSMCYIAKVDGKPALVLDNIELNPKYQYNDKIRDALFKYVKQLVCELGKPNMPVYAGPCRHKLNLSEETKKRYNVQIVGSSLQDEIYIDGLNHGCVVDEKFNIMLDLYRIQ